MNYIYKKFIELYINNIHLSIIMTSQIYKDGDFSFINNKEIDIVNCLEHVYNKMQKNKSLWLFFNKPIPENGYVLSGDKECSKILFIISNKKWPGESIYYIMDNLRLVHQIGWNAYVDLFANNKKFV